MHVATAQIHDIDIVVPAEHNLPPVRRPVGELVDSRIIREPRGVTTSIRVHHIDLEVAVPVTMEDDLLAVRRPPRPPVVPGMIRQVPCAATGAPDDVDVVVSGAVRREYDLLAIR